MYVCSTDASGARKHDAPTPKLDAECSWFTCLLAFWRRLAARLQHRTNKTNFMNSRTQLDCQSVGRIKADQTCKTGTFEYVRREREREGGRASAVRYIAVTMGRLHTQVECEWHRRGKPLISTSAVLEAERDASALQHSVQLFLNTYQIVELHGVNLNSLGEGRDGNTDISELFICTVCSLVEIHVYIM